MSNRQYGMPTGYSDSIPLERNTSNGVSPIEPPRNLPWSSNERMNQAQRYQDNGFAYDSQPSPESHYYDQHPTDYQAPPAGPYQMHSQFPQAQSQNSLAPLTRPQVTPTPSNKYSQTSLPHSSMAMSEFESRMPRVVSYHHGDGYDEIDPWDIADDGDDLEERPRQRSGFFRPIAAAGVGAGAGAGAGSAAGMFSSIGSRGVSGNYGPVSGGQGAEKSEWLRKQSSGGKRLKWIVGSGIALIVVGAIVGGVLGGVLGRSKSDSSSSSSSSSSKSGGPLYDINSSQVKAVLNNDNLHKVFPGMDYTPLNAQYPDCMHNPPDQNNITLDVAVMSQLAPSIRLYGTDCNQTEMVLESISRLNMNDTMKVWIGVYLNSNATTNARQLSQMYDILSTYPTSAFSGVIVGNEALFGKYLSATQLETELTNVRSNLTAKGIHLPISTADLGIAWQQNPSLATSSDIVMANVHPFFAGVIASQGASWAYSFWSTTDVPLKSARTASIPGTSTEYPTNIISEIGWPSEGGHDCGGDADTGYGCKTDDDGSVANITNVNTFLDVWVCDAMANGTMYFWFEAFDQPWQAIFNTKYDNWEAHWGLLDVNRNLKDGVVIPDCGGKTIDTAYVLPSTTTSAAGRRRGVVSGGEGYSGVRGGGTRKKS